MEKDIIKIMSIGFADWLKSNFEIDVEEKDSLWKDIYYKIDNIESKYYTTEELYDVYKSSLL